MSKRKKKLNLSGMAEPVQKTGILSLVEQKLFNLDDSNADNSHPYVNLKYYDPSFECFSDWNPQELKKFSSFCTKISKYTWQQLKQSGGSLGNKNNFGMTLHKDKGKLPNPKILNHISEDISFFELRIDKGIRVHGFRAKSAFFLVWLDRGHSVLRM